jgi:glyoxylase-like metal-dependent hydrolase (beta-lactamase superfamily II)
MLRTSTYGPLTRIQLLPTILGRPVYQVSAYLLGDTLIDSGCPRTAPELLAWSRDHGVRRIVHTHHHEDHAGGDALLARELGVEIVAPPRTVPILRSYYRIPLYRKVVWGQPADVDAHVMGEEIVIAGHRFQVIPTPGHASDHVCLYAPDTGWLFTGDLYISARVLYLRRAEDAWTHLQSLHHVASLRPRLVVCSHAGVLEEGTTAIQRRIGHWEKLARDVWRLRTEGLSLRAMTRRLLGREGWMTWISGGDFAKINLVRSLLESDPANCGGPHRDSVGAGGPDAVV